MDDHHVAHVGIGHDQEAKIISDLGSYPSLISHDIVDVSDVTLLYDMVVEAKFGDICDHFLFVMKWK